MLANLRLKLLAIFFAVALWSVVAYAANPTQTHTYKMTISQPTLPTGLVVVGDLPTIPLTVIGTAENLHAFDTRMVRVSGNFSGVHVGPNQVPIHIDNSDPNVQLDAPSSVGVQVDQLTSVTTPVTIERAHALLPGVHEQTNLTSVTPANVRVDGPKGLLANIQAVVQVDLESVQPPGINIPSAVVVRDAKTKAVLKVAVTPPQVTVKMVIQADAITIPKPVGWNLTGQPAAGYRVTNVQISPLEANATGLQNTLASVTLLQTDAVDVTNATADIVKTVTIRPPAGVTTAPATAQVHVSIAKSPQVSPSP